MGAASEEAASFHLEGLACQLVVRGDRPWELGVLEELHRHSSWEEEGEVEEVASFP